MADILVVDDRVDNLEIMRDTLEDCGYTVRTATNADAALTETKAKEPDLILLDLWLRESSLGGMDLLERVRSDHPLAPVIMISAHGNIEAAVQAIEQGAFTFIEKPVQGVRLRQVVQRALEMARLERENAAYRARDQRAVRLLGESPAMVKLRRTLESVAKHNSRVLFLGPPGVGKEEAARYLHLRSPSAEAAFVSIGANAFTDGIPSVWAQAESGTLLIDEIADLGDAGQRHLLRALVEQTIARPDTSGRNVRVLSTSTQDPRKLIEEGKLREDLYHRLAVVEVNLPPLSARRGDIPELATHFMELIASDLGRQPREFEAPAMSILQTHAWSGNIRELRNVIERLLIAGRSGQDGSPVTVGEIPTDLDAAEPVAHGGDGFAGMTLREARKVFERQYLLFHAALADGNVLRMSEQVGVERTALYRKLRSLDIFGQVRAVDSGPDDTNQPS